MNEVSTAIRQYWGFDRLRPRQAGVQVTSTVRIISEMVADWSIGAGPKLMPVLSAIYAEIAETGE